MTEQEEKKKVLDLVEHVKCCLDENYIRGIDINMKLETTQTGLGEYVPHIAYTGWKTITIRYFDPGEN